MLRFFGVPMGCFLSGPKFQGSLTASASRKASRAAGAAGVAESTGSDRGAGDDGVMAADTIAEKKDDRGSDPIVILGTLVSGLLLAAFVLAFVSPLVLYGYTYF